MNNNIQFGGSNKNNKNMDFEKKINQIINLITKSNKNKIKNQLFNVINYDYYCPIIIGEGHFGKAYIPQVYKTIPFIFGDKKVDLPIIIKESKHIKNNTYFGLDIIDKKLYINGQNNITTEALILMFIRKIYDKTVHLPLILGYGTCLEKNMINRIITYRYGLDKKITIDLSNKFYNENKNKDEQNIFSSSIATLYELFKYIYYSKNKDGSVILPNGIKCDNISELYDSICISYLVTHQLLTDNNIYPSDLHSENIFIHWLNDNSYYNRENIKNVKEIVYKIKNKYYKIKTFGFVIILGDVGTFNINVKEDVMIIGDTWNIQEQYKLIKKQNQPEYTNTEFIFRNSFLLTPKEYHNSVIYNILNSEPYSSYSWAFNISNLKKLKTFKLLEFYDEKYGVNKYVKNKNNILININ
jgi:hypothetical protein